MKNPSAFLLFLELRLISVTFKRTIFAGPIFLEKKEINSKHIQKNNTSS